MTPEQKMALFIAAARMAQAIADGSPKEVLEQVHQDVGFAIAQIPAMPADLTDAAAERDTSLAEDLKDAKFGPR